MYLYYAIFSYEDGAYNVSFPDLYGAFTFGDTMSDALHMAKDLLEGWLVVAEDEEDEIPVPSEPKDIKIEDGELLIPIEANLAIARAKFENKLIKKTLTIPKYINMMAEEANINFSATLTDVLKEKLGV